MLEKLLNYKPGTAFTIIAVLVLFFGMMLFARYHRTGRVNLRGMVDRDLQNKPFWERNPHLEQLDWYPHTGFVLVRDRPTGRTAIVDLAVGLNAELRPVSCDDSGGLHTEMIYSGAEEVVCFTIEKPDTGAGTRFTSGMSFTAKAKDSQVAQFYRDLFTSHSKRISTIQNSSQAIILEAENEDQDTVARISIRGSFDTARGFLAWTKEFR